MSSGVPKLSLGPRSLAQRHMVGSHYYLLGGHTAMLKPMTGASQANGLHLDIRLDQTLG